MPIRRYALFCGRKHTENWYQHMVLQTTSSQFGNILRWQRWVNLYLSMLCALAPLVGWNFYLVFLKTILSIRLLNSLDTQIVFWIWLCHQMVQQYFQLVQMRPCECGSAFCQIQTRRKNVRNALLGPLYWVQALDKYFVLLFTN